MAGAASACRPSRPFLWRLLLVVLAIAAITRVPLAITLSSSAPVVRIDLDVAGPAPADAPPPGVLPPDLPLPALPAPDELVTLPGGAAQASNAAVPFQPIDAAAPGFHGPAAPDARDRAADCLAAAAWYEAGDTPQGERAVVQVVLNRVRHPAFAKTVCGVVFQGAPTVADSATNISGGNISRGCQFTFASDGALIRRRPAPPAWARARAIALAALSGAVDRDVGLATHYHADYVVPRWRDAMAKLAMVGPHLFYHWSGFWGTAAALRNPPPGLAEPRIPALARLSAAHGAPAGRDTPTGTAIGVALAAMPEDDTVTTAPAHPAAMSVIQTDRFVLPLDPGAYPGSYAVRAYGLCRDHPHCLVTGHTPASTVPAFLFLRDARRGVETALWNCALTPRPDPGQCLPDAAAIARMTTGW